MLTTFALNSFLGNIDPASSFKSTTPITFNLLRQKVSFVRNEEKNTTTSSSDTKEQIPFMLTEATQVSKARSEIFQLGAHVGGLCSKVLLYAPLDKEDNSKFWKNDSPGKDEISMYMGKILLSLLELCEICQLDLCTCIVKKMHLNGKKYPVELCKGKSGKYTVYSNETGITKTSGQSTMTSEFMSLSNETMQHVQSLQNISLKIRNFASERDWEKHHSPRNIALALMGELGELAELLQYKGDNYTADGDVVPDITDEERDHLGQEVADVCIYLIRMADVCHIDLGKSALTV